MLIRTKINILFLFVLLFVILSFLLAFYFKEQKSTLRFQDLVYSGQLGTWSKILDNKFKELEKQKTSIDLLASKLNEFNTRDNSKNKLTLSDLDNFKNKFQIRFLSFHAIYEEAPTIKKPPIHKV